MSPDNRERDRGPPSRSGRYPSSSSSHPPHSQYRDEFGRMPSKNGPPLSLPPPPLPPSYYDTGGGYNQDHHYRGGLPQRHPPSHSHAHSHSRGPPPPSHYREGGGIPPGRWERGQSSPRRHHRGGARLLPRNMAQSHSNPHAHAHSNPNPHTHTHSNPHPHYPPQDYRGRRRSSGLGRSLSRSLSRSRSRSRSVSRSSSRSGSLSSSSSFSSRSSYESRSRSRSRSGSRSRSRSHSRSRSRSGSRSRSRSVSLSRSRSRSRSPGERTKSGEDSCAAVRSAEKPMEPPLPNEKKDEGIAATPVAAAETATATATANATEDHKPAKTNDQAVSPSSKASSRNSRKRHASSRSRSRSRSASHDRSSPRRSGRGRSKIDQRRSLSRSRSRSISSRSRSRSTSPIGSESGYSTSSSRYEYSHRRRRDRKSRRRREKRRQERPKKIGERDKEKAKDKDKDKDDALLAFSKDQRTVFVSQLVMRTTERDLKKYFKKTVGCKVNDVILLRDRRNARNHKGCAYVEVGRIEDVARAVEVSGKPPDFQRFPILVKASEAEKNYTYAAANATAAAAGGGGASAAAAVVTASGTGASTTPDGDSSRAMSSLAANAASAAKASFFLPPLRDESGRLIESQKVYVGGLDASVTEDHLFALFSQFGTLHRVHLQTDATTRTSKGYAFLSFRDPKVAHLAMRTMAGQVLAGRPLKTGWANQNQQTPASLATGCSIVTSDRFPDHAGVLAQKALLVLAQMTGGSFSASASYSGIASGSFPSAAAAAPSTVGSRSDPSPALALASMAEHELDKAMGLTGTAAAAAVLAPTATASTASSSSMPTVAEARASLAADVVARQLAAATAARSRFIGNPEHGPTRHLMVHNMYDKDEETEQGWEREIRDEFLEECSRFGTIEDVRVLHTEPGGKIRTTFAAVEAAKNCAENLAGRWFDKRQLRVDYLQLEGARTTNDS